MSRTAGSKQGVIGNNIDKVEFEKLCSILCTEEEIANFFGCSHDTVDRWCMKTYKMHFQDIWKIKSTDGKCSLRRFQFKQAETNPAMAIWLGKQVLGQTDKQEQTSTERVEFVNDIPKE